MYFATVVKLSGESAAISRSHRRRRDRRSKDRRHQAKGVTTEQQSGLTQTVSTKITNQALLKLWVQK